MNKVAKIFLILNGAASCMVGIQGLFTPQVLMDAVQIQLENPSALISIMASYGGVNVVFGSYLIFSAFRQRIQGLGLLGLYMGGFVLGRLLGLAQLGEANTFVYTWLCIESAFMASAFLLIRQLKKAEV